MDSRLKCTPREYLANPSAFGATSRQVRVMPKDGNLVSQLTALRQHHLAAKYNALPVNRRLSVATITRLYGISKQTWSRLVNGHIWAQQLGVTALEAASSYQSKKQPLL